MDKVVDMVSYREYRRLAEGFETLAASFGELRDWAEARRIEAATFRRRMGSLRSDGPLKAA